jgi:hypothetical protein
MAGENRYNCCDNTAPAIAWQTKGSTSTTKVTANLLCHTALHPQDTGHVHKFEHLAKHLAKVAGERYVMTDNATSHLWNHDNTNLLAYFNATYPQIKPWQMCHLSQPG